MTTPDILDHTLDRIGKMAQRMRHVVGRCIVILTISGAVLTFTFDRLTDVAPSLLFAFLTVTMLPALLAALLFWRLTALAALPGTIKNILQDFEAEVLALRADTEAQAQFEAFLSDRRRSRINELRTFFKTVRVLGRFLSNINNAAGDQLTTLVVTYGSPVFAILIALTIAVTLLWALLALVAVALLVIF